MFERFFSAVVISLWMITASAAEFSYKYAAVADNVNIGNAYHVSDKHESKTPSVALVAFRITDKTGHILLEMDRLGKIHQEGKLIGSIDKIGTVVDANGKLMASLRGNRILESSDGKPLVKISADGTLDDESGVLIHWSKDGMFTQGEKMLDAKLTPPNPSARVAASITYFLRSSIGGESKVVELPHGKP